MSKTKLFSIVIPHEVTERTSLYIRTAVREDPRIVPSGESVSLDTYFNSFSVAKYLKYTNVTEVTTVFDLVGSWNIELLVRENQNVIRKVAEKQYAGKERRYIEFPFSLREGQGKGFLWFRLTALSDTCTLFGGEYLTEAPVKLLRISAVICTFHREEYMTKNLVDILQQVANSPKLSALGEFTLYVIDNGQSLMGRLPEDPRLRLFYNKNCGGSSGFTRGMMEVLRNKNCSHIILMDDDIEVEPEVFWKTISFLAHLKPEYAHLHIAGGMLFFDEPTVQHEASARWNGTEHSLKHTLQLNDPEQLIINEEEEKADYAAWWFLCIPTCCISLNNLPLPLFIKCDDIEYGLRNMRMCTVINGIGVWHESFDKKFNTVLDYYSIRNELILNGIYQKAHVRQALWLLLKPCLRSIAYGLTTSLSYVDMAVNDYLQGVENFRQIDGEAKNSQLRAMSPQSYIFPRHSNPQRVWSILSKFFTLGFWNAWFQYFKIAGRYLLRHKQADRDWKNNWKQLTTKEFWNHQLELED